MTNTSIEARVAPAAEAPLTEQISSLVPRELRAYLLGCVEADGARGEGVVVRALLTQAVVDRMADDRDEYLRRLHLGDAELQRRGR